MIIFINENNEIKDVDTTSKENLTALVLTDDNNPFKGWSKAKICCYAVQLDRDGNIGGYYPYIDTEIISVLDGLAPTIITKNAYIGDSAVIFDNVVNGNISVYAITESGIVVYTITEKIGNDVKVSFATLEEAATITLSIR